VLTIGSIVWGVTDIPTAVDFWTRALDFELRAEPSDDWASLRSRTGDGVRLSLKRVSSDDARRHHIDLFTPDQQGEVERLIALGATRVDGWDYEDDADYVVLADPHGSPFCVVQETP
jgi:catechol 2,3-dioxygenase-like lactoylglutathione lyase family enzyme